MKTKYKFYVPFVEEPESKPIEWSEFEDILEFDSKTNNVIYTGEKRNLQVEIDSYKDQCLLYNILDKYAGINSHPEMLSEIPELNKKEGFYADLSNLPKNIHDLKKLSESVQKQLKELQQLEKEKSENVQDNTEIESLKDNEKNIQNIKETKQTDKEIK